MSNTLQQIHLRSQYVNINKLGETMKYQRS